MTNTLLNGFPLKFGSRHALDGAVYFDAHPAMNNSAATQNSAP